MEEINKEEQAVVNKQEIQTTNQNVNDTNSTTTTNEQTSDGVETKKPPFKKRKPKPLIAIC